MIISRQRERAYPRYGWRAEVVYWAKGRARMLGGERTFYGVGSTPTKARLDLLRQQLRRR